MAKLNMAYLSSLKNRAKLQLSSLPLGYSVPPAHHRTIWCRSTFGPRGPGLSNPTSFLRPALPMAPTTDNNARDERSVPRPNPATFLRDFTLYMTSNYAILWKRCLNYITCTTTIITITIIYLQLLQLQLLQLLQSHITYFSRILVSLKKDAMHWWVNPSMHSFLF